jgi:hypothetical protein
MRIRPLLVAATLTVTACDLGPSGPSRILGTVTGEATLGAAVIDFTWEGVGSVEGRGDTEVFSAPVSGSPDRHRVILVGPAGGELRFTVLLDQARLYGPALTVVSAVGTDNLPVDPTELRVVLERTD